MLRWAWAWLMHRWLHHWVWASRATPRQLWAWAWAMAGRRGQQEKSAPRVATALLLHCISFRLENFNKSLKNAHMASLLID